MLSVQNQSAREIEMCWCLPRPKQMCRGMSRYGEVWRTDAASISQVRKLLEDFRREHD